LPVSVLSASRAARRPRRRAKCVSADAACRLDESTPGSADGAVSPWLRDEKLE
jgi:hypothetical protein